MTKVEHFARDLLDKLKELDRLTSSSYYVMGQMLHALQRDELYLHIGYDTFRELVEEELTISYGTAGNYILAYERFRQLRYKKAEAIEIMGELGLSPCLDWLRKTKQRASVPATKKHIRELRRRNRQLNVSLPAPKYEEVMNLLREYGAHQVEDGRWSNTSEAFLAMAQEVIASRRRTKRAA